MFKLNVYSELRQARLLSSMLCGTLSVALRRRNDQARTLAMNMQPERAGNILVD
jgi:hypothetical protein